MKIRNVIMLISALALTGLLASCMPQTFSASQAIDSFSSHLKSDLQLTPEQNQKLQVLNDAVKQKFRENYDSRKAQNGELLDLIKSPKLDQEGIRMKMKDSLASSAENMDAMLDEFLPKFADFHDSLTPAQKQKIADKVAKMMDKMRP